MKQSSSDIDSPFSSGPVQRLLADLENSDVHKILLKHRDLLGIPTAELVKQLQSRRKAKEKLPLYYHTPGAVFPPEENLEQCSSEATARFKSHLIQRRFKGAALKSADLTGGFGVDTFFLSSISSEVHYVEPDQNLLRLARYNHGLLKASNIAYHSALAEEFLQQTTTTFDVIYIDPSRRTADKRRVYSLEDARPNVLGLKDAILERAKVMVVKTSPLLDIQAGISRLGNVARVTIVALQNECKELLFWCESGKSVEPLIEAFNISTAGQAESQFSFTFSEERAALADTGPPQSFLHEPNAAILKAGAFKTIAQRYGLRKIHPHTHLYTSAEPVSDFPGRIFQVETFIKADVGDVEKHFPDGKGNVMTRNYPLSPEALKKKIRLKDGGDNFLIAFSGTEKKYVAVARRL